MSNSALLRAKILALVSAKIIALLESQKGQLVTINGVALVDIRNSSSIIQGRTKSLYIY